MTLQDQFLFYLERAQDSFQIAKRLKEAGHKEAFEDEIHQCQVYEGRALLIVNNSPSVHAFMLLINKEKAQ